MNKYVIDRVEWYPVFTLRDAHSGFEDKIPVDKVAWIERVTKEFAETQDYLRGFNA